MLNTERLANSGLNIEISPLIARVQQTQLCFDLRRHVRCVELEPRDLVPGARLAVV
jgi:hypothetical protein